MDLPVMSREQFKAVIRKVKPHLTEEQIEEKLRRREWWANSAPSNDSIMGTQVTHIILDDLEK